jgi:ligand-binding sensor domain-containing protein/signal transduction histidine kinase
MNGIRKIFLMYIFFWFFTFVVKGQEKGLDPSRKISQYVFKHWGTDNGLHSNSINSVRQFSDGYIWLATYNGLLRFDGKSFTNISLTEHISKPKGNSYLYLYEDRERNAWVGSDGNGLFLRKGTDWKVFTTAEGLPSNIIQVITQDISGHLWVGTSNGLAYLPKGGFRFQRADTGINNVSITALLPNEDQTLWVGTNGFGLILLGKDGKVLQHLESEFARKTITALQKDDAGVVWIGTDQGLHLLMKDNELLPLGNENELPGSRVTALYEDLRGGMWIGLNGGLSRYYNNRLDHLPDEPAIKGQRINCIMEDREGHLWVSTAFHGFYQLSQGKFVTYGARDGIGGELPYAITESPNGEVLVGTEKGIFIFNGKSFLPFVTKPAIEAAVRGLCYDSKNRLWVATHQGAYRVDGQQAVHFSTKDGLGDQLVFSIVEDRQGGIWLATRRGLNLYIDGKFKTYSCADGLPNDFIVSLFADSKNRLWIGSKGGLSVYENNAFRNFNVEDGMASDAIFKITEDHQGGIWVATQGGVSYFNDTDKPTSFYGKWSPDNRMELPFYAVFQVLTLPNNKLWMTTNEGIYQIHKDYLFNPNNSKTEKPRLYDRHDGMKTSECLAHALSMVKSDGSIWFSTTKGLVVVEDPENIPGNIEPPRPVIEAVIVDGVVQDLSKPIVLPTSADRLEIHYTALNFSSPDQVLFSYMLDNYDQKKNETRDRKVIYTNLPGGRYKFILLAANEDRTWSGKSEMLTIIKAKEIWESEIFFFALPFLAIIGYFLLANVLNETQKRKMQLLEEIVEERTLELARQKNMVLEKNHQLEQSRMDLEHINQELIEINKEKNHLIGVVAHDLKSPLNQINGLIEVMRMMGENLSKDEREEYNGYIQNSVTRLNNMISQILDIEAIESKKIKLELTFFNVNKTLGEVVQSFEQMAARKQIVIHHQLLAEFMIKADERITYLVFQNLLSNALKFSRRGTNIYLDVQALDGAIRISVQDEGPGISKEDMPKLFGKYQKLTARPTNGEDSTGLGLSIVKQYVEAMGGKVWCESEPGHGATFFVEFPCSEGPKVEAGDLEEGIR